MTEYAIRAEGLSKQYSIGGARQGYQTMRESLTEAVVQPFRRVLFGRERPAQSELLWALRDVNFEIKQGEVIGVIGRNGAGKSTLLKILSRITDPTQGRVAVRGRVATLLEVGTGFHPELTGRENIFLNGAILGMPRAQVRKRFDEIVDFADIERFINTPVKHYSSGMYMRLAFAVAAHLETDILLVDEVLAVGDASFQQKCLAKMEDVAGLGRTVLFVSHNMSALQSLCDRVIHLVSGSVAEEGEPKKLIQKYLETSTLSNGPSRPTEVGQVLTIEGMSLSPNPLQTGSDLHFELKLKANQRLKLTEVTPLVYALEGPLVGIVDVRESGFPFVMEPGDRLCIQGSLRSVPLVERQYRIGLWIDCGSFLGDVKNIGDLIVSPAIGKSAYAPSNPEYRGWVQFESESKSFML